MKSRSEWPEAQWPMQRGAETGGSTSAFLLENVGKTEVLTRILATKLVHSLLNALLICISSAFYALLCIFGVFMCHKNTRIRTVPFKIMIQNFACTLRCYNAPKSRGINGHSVPQ